ncbi:MAG: phosphotransferase family protein [Thermomicrobiales bacterium]
MSLDIEQHAELIGYLHEQGWIEPDEVPDIDVLAGGVSNRTVLVERANGEAWVLKQALAKLRVQVDWFSPPERVHREADGLRWLERLAPPGTTTPLVFEDFEHHLIAMQAVPRPHRNWKAMLLDGELRTGHVVQFATLLGKIHGKSSERLAELRPVFGDRGYFESLRLEPYYGYTMSQVPDAATFLQALIDETRSHAETIVHGDYSPKNVLVHGDRLILLDHEVIHIGDPGFDLGFSMTHLLSKAHHRGASRDAFAAATKRYWDTYWNIVNTYPWASELEARAVRHTLGCLLARVRGRSPLEYLDATERNRQAAVVVALMADRPATIETLTDRFIAGIAAKE